MKRFFLNFFLVGTLALFSACTSEVTNIKSDIESKAKGAYDTADKTVKQVERKVQQGKEAVDAVNTASEKIKAFQGQ